MSNSNKSDKEIKSKVAEYVDIDKNDNLGSIYTLLFYRIAVIEPKEIIN